MFVALEQHFERWAQTVSESVSQSVRSFLDHAKAEEAKVAAEVEHLKSLGMQVLKDGSQL